MPTVGNLLCTSSAISSSKTHRSIHFFMSLLNHENIGRTRFYENQKQLSSLQQSMQCYVTREFCRYSELEKLLNGQKCNQCEGSRGRILSEHFLQLLLCAYVGMFCLVGNHNHGSGKCQWESYSALQVPFSWKTHRSIDFFMSLLNLENIGKTRFYTKNKLN